MSVRMWEWIIDFEADRDAAGVSGSIHGAMHALSLALVQTGGPSTGHVISMLTRDGADGWHYDRLEIAYTARFEKGVIKWKRTGMALTGPPPIEMFP